MKNKWLDAFLSQIEGREDLGKEGLFTEYFEPLGLDKSDVFECFEFIEGETGRPLGMLRPDDSLSLLTEAPPTSSSLRRFFWERGVRTLKAR